jgi:proteasome accessory factor A
LQQFCDQENIPWNDPWLRSQDLEFHHVDPARSLGLAVARTPAPWDLPQADAIHAVQRAPANTRAAVRSRIMRQLQDAPCSYYIDWEIIGVEGGHALHLLNPFDPAPKDAEKWMQFLTQPSARPPGPARKMV